MVKTAARSSQNSLFLSVKNPEHVVYEGEAFAITSVNEKGLFDVLPKHQNFISMINEKLIIHLSKGFKKEFKIGQGVLKAQKNIVKIFLGLEQISEL